jgi:peroxiredoxin Q/BCP
MLLRFLKRFIPGGGTTMKLRPGDPAPAFAAVDHHGEEITSSQLEGQRYVLWFYPKADTPG